MKPLEEIILMKSGHCPVCEEELQIGSLTSMVLSTSRGKQLWTKCPGCRSFFSVEGYDSEQEAQHTRTRPWGMAESGIALNDEKSPMFNAVLRLIRHYAPPESTLLDVGCSFGGFLFRAREEGYKVRGIDIVPEAVEYVRSRGIHCDRAASAGDLDIAENSLGIVTALDSN